MTTSETTAGKTLVTLLLDRSGSMETVRDDTIGAINAYLDTLREAESDMRFSLVLFDSDYAGTMSLQALVEAAPLDEVPPLTRESYVPRGGTPLIDAACATIRAVSESLARRRNADPVKVVMAIQTDGQENNSCENDWKTLRKLISEKEEMGWEFLFMGCGIDAYEQGRKMGLSAAKTVSYGTSREMTRAAFAATAQNTAAFASGLAGSAAYTDAQKLDAGDLLGK